MSKSVELGRAVLSTSTANFELWLRTLITISPQQECTNLEQHDATSLLGLLSSGEVWVGRGNGLHIDLDLTLRGQPLADQQLQQLSETILDAPVWLQLNLKPSLPFDAAHEPGRLRVMVNHSSESATMAAKPRHRILSNTSAADVRPPEGVPAFSLDSIALCMDVFELVPRRSFSTAKRLKTSMIGMSPAQLQDSQSIDDPNLENRDALLLDLEAHHSSLVTLPTLKRPRSLAPTAEQSATSPATPPSEAIYDSQLTTQEVTLDSYKGSGPTGMRTLIDGALRLSILSTVNSKMLPGIKILANTFGPGLADIAPALWKPGYLSSLSQRASLLPTISRSLCRRETITKITSMSLKSKWSALAAQLPSFKPPVYTQDREHTATSDRSCVASSIAPWLWLHLQRNTSCKATTSLQSFFASEIESVSLPDDILEEPWQWAGQTIRSRPNSVSRDVSDTSDVIRNLEGRHSTTAASDEPSSDLCLLGGMATPASILEPNDDELLLGDECFEDANLSAFRSSEAS